VSGFFILARFLLGFGGLLQIMKDWPLLVTVEDLIWGTLLAASISGMTYFISSKI
jgi:uncharacterized membrane protein